MIIIASHGNGLADQFTVFNHNKNKPWVQEQLKNKANS